MNLKITVCYHNLLYKTHFILNTIYVFFAPIKSGIGITNDCAMEIKYSIQILKVIA